ncbi:MAG: hypothetical protein ABIQ07_05270 [Ginsengibacter sp.]
MRKYQSVILFFLLAIGVVACKKSDSNFVAPETLQIGAYIRLDSTINTKLSPTVPVSIMVSGVGEPLTKIISYVSTDGTADKTKWKKIVETAVANNKATITFTNSQLATALGVPPSTIAPGSSYTIYNELYTTSGKTYSIINTSSSFEPEAAYNMALRFSISVVCAFDPVGFPGNFQILEDGWADFSVGDIVQVTAATANSITMLVYPAPSAGSNRKPIVVDVDPATGAATVKAQVYGDYSGEKITAKTSGSSNFVFSCVGTITLTLNHTGNSNYGNYKLRLKKI